MPKTVQLTEPKNRMVSGVRKERMFSEEFGFYTMKEFYEIDRWWWLLHNDVKTVKNTEMVISQRWLTWYLSSHNYVFHHNILIPWVLKYTQPWSLKTIIKTYIARYSHGWNSGMIVMEVNLQFPIGFQACSTGRNACLASDQESMAGELISHRGKPTTIYYLAKLTQYHIALQTSISTPMEYCSSQTPSEKFLCSGNSH